MLDLTVSGIIKSVNGQTEESPVRIMDVLKGHGIIPQSLIKCFLVVISDTTETKQNQYI